MRRSCGGAESLSAWCAWGDGAQQKGKGKAQAGSGAAGGGPSNKAAAAASSSGEASSSRGEASRPSTLPSGGAGHHITVEDAVQPALPAAVEAASGSQQTEPQPQPAGGGKKEKERQRKERQRQRKMDEAREALQGAIEAMLDARCVRPYVDTPCIGRYPPFPREPVVWAAGRAHV
jgi:hypothetical protein